ncbi:type VII secretion target [Streptomyces sp. NPDC088789]|uniref:type VII secretion target n=1 Tax=Streptomyces sp. NPDC088789 TaxID=3365899 RepID=UPI0038011D77
MASGEGYQVTSSAMTGQAKELQGASGDAGRIRTAVRSTECHTSDVLGGSASGPAFNAFAAAWSAEARTLEDALKELAANVQAADGSYGGSDRLVRTRASGVRTADGQLTTLPVAAERPSALSTY